VTRRVLVLVALALAGGALAAGVSRLPRLLRRMDVFRVRRVEVLGAHYMTAESVLAASGITSRSNVFDDTGVWRRALLAQPLVMDAEVRRQPPGTVVLQIVETRPVALARGDVLRPVDARGRLLPVDPARVSLDVPVLDVPADTMADGRLRAPAATAVLAVLDRIRRFEPGLARQISEVGVSEGSIVLHFRDPSRAVALLPLDLDAVRLRELATTLADLDTRQELPRLRRIDARFHEQIVVSLNPSTD
jgi:cell division septal protein FtsQ